MSDLQERVARAIYQWWMDDMPPAGKVDTPYEEWGDKNYFRRCAKAAIDTVLDALLSDEVLKAAAIELYKKEKPCWSLGHCKKPERFEALSEMDKFSYLIRAKAALTAAAQKLRGEG